MANRAFLVLTQANDPDIAYDADAIVAAANYLLPVLWCAVFGPDAIAWRSLDQTADEDEEDETAPRAYPVLLAASELVRLRARDRREVFFRVFPRTLESVYGEWLALLDGVDAPYLLVDTLELWGMMEPDAFQENLTEYVGAFEFTDPRYWSAVLHQASIDFDPTTAELSFDEKAIPYLLRGGEWLRPVPWKE